MPYRILALDGGGSWALIQVRALITFYGEKATGHRVLQDFDLVAANSGGSLVLGGLVEGLPLGDLLGYFLDEDKRRSIFSSTSSWGDKALEALTGLGPKYSAENKLPALQTLLPKAGNLPLADAANNIKRSATGAAVRLLVVGFDYDRNKATFFRSAPSGPGWGEGDVSKVKLAEAIHASTNAPVNYFDGPATFPDGPGRYWDGGVTGCNNPVLAAVTEALTLGIAPADIAALSLGTGNVCLPAPATGQAPYVRSVDEAGLVNDLRKLAASILDDPPDAATFIAHVMTGGPKGVKAPAESRVVRMNPLISPVKDPAGKWTAPAGMTAAQFQALVKLDMDAIKPDEVAAISRFADLWLDGKVPNQPIRMNSDTLKREIGYDSFAAASQAWNAISV